MASARHLARAFSKTLSPILIRCWSNELPIGRSRSCWANPTLPEFGAGSQTYNEVFGATLNPFDTAKTCGGSSGGAAVSLACHMVPIADGTDLGGSVRNPASFCNVVGLRPTAGRVPVQPFRGLRR